jgi:NMT1/THI5 like protein
VPLPEVPLSRVINRVFQQPVKDEEVPVERLILYPHVFDPYPLINDGIDAMSAYITDEPFILNKEGIEYQRFSPQSGGIDFYGDVLFATEQQINANPERAHAFLEASLRGWNYSFEHLDEIIGLILSRYSTRHSREHLKYEAEKMREFVIPEIVELGYMNPGRWEHIRKTYAKLGMVAGHYSLEGFLYDRTEKSRSPWIYAVMGGVGVIVLMLIFMLLVLMLMGASQLFRKMVSGDR